MKAIGGNQIFHSRHDTVSYIAQFLAYLRNDSALYALVGIFLAAATFHLLNGQNAQIQMLDQYLFGWTFHFVVAGPFCAFTFGAVHIAWRMKGRKRLAYRTMFAPKRLARFVAGTVFLMTGGLLFTSTFSSIKTNFSNANSFLYDRLHADIDKYLHFGVDPFHYLYSFAKFPWLLQIVETNYSIVWFVVCYFALYFVMTSPRTDRIRVRFALTWFGSWILVGTVMASQWLSAGPAYYGYVTGDTKRFAEQLAFLATTGKTSTSALNFQEYLWQLHQTGHSGLGSGISAFPSMHVALIAVVALFAGERSRRLGFIAWSYTAFVMFSSVYLGWHYAIDGYVSIAAVTALYWALRALVPRLTPLSARLPLVKGPATANR